MLLFASTQALVFPNRLYEVVFEEELSTTNISVRLYGGALLSKSSLLKHGEFPATQIILVFIRMPAAAVIFFCLLMHFVQVIIERNSHPGAAEANLIQLINVHDGFKYCMSNSWEYSKGSW